MHISFIFYKVVQRRIYGVVGYIIITLLQIVRSVPVKEFWKSVNNWRRYGQK